MTDSREVYSIYMLAYARQEARPYGEFDKTLASSLGCIHSRSGKMLMPTELAAQLREMGAEPDAEQDDAPDVGPTDRDERERAEAEARLRRLVLADGQTDTGGRWIADAAADEIVRLRNDRDDDKAALAGAHAELTRLRGEAQMAREALEQARAKVEELRATSAPAAEQIAGLSAEDAATLRGAGWVEYPGSWEDGHGGKWVKNVPNLETLRMFAAELRGEGRACGAAALSKPAAAHGAPGKATGVEATAAGSGSLAEEQGATQGTSQAPGQDAAPHGGDREQRVDGAPRPGADVAAELARSWLTFRLNMLNRLRYPGDDSEARLERFRGNGRGWRSAMRRLCAAFGIPEPIPGGTGAEHARALLAQETSLLSLSTWQLAEAPSALPKPARVEAGQRWGVTGPGGVDDLKVERATERSGAPGNDVYLRPSTGTGTSWMTTDLLMLSEPAWTFLGAAPQDPSPKRGGEREKAADVVDGALAQHGLRVDRATLGLAPKGSGEPVETSEPTAGDAVAGMLLRHGYYDAADDLAGGESPGVVAVEMAGAVSGHVCIAALEALARGEIRPTESLGLLVDIARATKERDEARAELLKRYLEFAPTLAEIYDVRDICGAQPGEPAPAAVRRALAEARAEAAALRGEAKAMAEDRDRALGIAKDLAFVAKVSLRDADATAEMRPAEDGDAGRIAIPGADDLHLFSARPDGRVDLIVPKSIDPRAALATVAELLGISPDVAALDEVTFQRLTPDELEELAQRITINGGIGARWLRGVAAGIREGERRAKVKAAELVKKWKRLEGRAMAERLKLDSSDVLWKQLLTEEANLARCARETGSAFGFRVEPADPGQLPTSGPAPVDEPQCGGPRGERVPVVPGKPTAEERAAVQQPAEPTTPHAEVMASVAERAHADGIVEGLLRARRIIDTHGGEGYSWSAVSAAIGDDIKYVIPLVAPGDRQPHGAARAALLELVTGWENMAAQLSQGAGDSPAGLLEDGEARGLRVAALALRRLLNEPARDRATPPDASAAAGWLYDRSDAGPSAAPCPGIHVDCEPCDLCASASPAGVPDREALGRAVHEPLAVYACSREDCDRNGKRVYRTELHGDGWCENCGRKLDRVGTARACATPSDASAAATVPESQTSGAGAPWRGLAHGAQPDCAYGRWSVVAWDPAPPGRPLHALFDGPHAEERAREYAAWVSAPLPCSPVLLIGQDRAADDGVWRDRHGGRFVDAAAPAPPDGQPVKPPHNAEQGALGVPVGGGAEACASELGRLAEKFKRELDSRPIAVTGLKGEPVINLNIEVHLEPGADSGEVATKLEREIRKAIASATAPIEPASPETPDPRWEPGAVWELHGLRHEVETATRWAEFATLTRAGGARFVVRRAYMTESNGWRCVGPAKPAQVKPGQVWRCVGVEGELEVSGVVRDAVDRVSLRRDGAHKADVGARAIDMLGLREWTFVRGPR